MKKGNGYRYLGTIIDSRLTDNYTQIIFKNCQEQVYLLWKLKHLEVASPTVHSYFICHIESFLTFSFLAWYGGLSEINKSKLHVECAHHGAQALWGAVLLVWYGGAALHRQQPLTWLMFMAYDH